MSKLQGLKLLMRVLSVTLGCGVEAASRGMVILACAVRLAVVDLANRRPSGEALGSELAEAHVKDG